ncbi:hypothetical protein Back11_41620 [Paenibacillus baekrokdamisoli]|uniref:Amidohydrolase-related domain-containing protein n=1 Tax=Paenibacillus baekrokdamisoli TaxID=1712516 RepID=A0A3G9IVF6_9BACL|nr:amidohydrolase family protein [Paenibacillus baekrokdamisoli]MBB3068139.1 hypothetical protein [Paenibacillus baekrokdamisoli]BBH22817.1 hypothetical protein Back11_41620 [Paenibacillus baekrokdamisoli]
MIDAHIHLSGSDLHPDTLAEGERLGIRHFVGSCLGEFQFQPSFEEVYRANQDMAGVIRRYSNRVSGYCYVNPRHGEQAISDFRHRIEDDSMIGIKLWVATYCNDPLVFPFVEQAIAYRAPILIHAWRKTVGQLAYESTAFHVADLAERYPEANIIMAHMGGQVESAMNTIAPYSNVRIDTSGTPIGTAEVMIAVERLGADRVIFGSDLPIACLASNIGKVIGAGLSPQQLELVMGGNMEKILAEVIR